jgi:hypothetical protein
MADLSSTINEGVYTDIDLNSTGTTEIHSSDADSEVSGVFLENGGSTAEVNLEVTDGTDTAVLAQPGAGSSIEFGETIYIGKDDSLQINVTTAEGSAQTNTAVVFKGE